MGSHQEFRELCAAATAGELSPDERAKLTAHLTVCPDCRRIKAEYEAAALAGIAALAESLDPSGRAVDLSWSLEQAEVKLFKRLSEEGRSASVASNQEKNATTGEPLAYRPSQIRWREVWMPFAAAMLLALALVVAAYRSGLECGTDTVLQTARTLEASETSFEAQLSDAGYERTQLQAKLADSAKTIDDLKRQLATQVKIVNSLKSPVAAPGRSGDSKNESQRAVSAAAVNREADLSAAQTKLGELQKAVDAAVAQGDENALRAAALEVKVNELTQLVRTRDQALNQKEAEVAKGQEWLERDRDIRELMGARELYMADVHDVSGPGTEKTYGRIFYTKGRSLIFYAFDLDAQPGFRNARSFQAWGRKGTDKAQARSLGIFYEDNSSKKRWVLKADDPKTLEDIDAVFVTVEPHGGSQHPSGKQLLFASLRISPNHP
jgi:hypothetical protein